MCAQGALRFLLCVRAQAVPNAVNNVYPTDMSPTRLSNTDSCGSCPWRIVFVVTKRLCQSVAPDLGSSVFIMAPQHHMEVHKGRMVVFVLRHWPWSLLFKYVLDYKTVVDMLLQVVRKVIVII